MLIFAFSNAIKNLQESKEMPVLKIRECIIVMIVKGNIGKVSLCTSPQVDVYNLVLVVQSKCIYKTAGT